MNEKIAMMIKDKIKELGLKYAYVSSKTKIPYWRLVGILNKRVTISARELLLLCKALGIKQKTLLELVDSINNEAS